MRKTKNVFVLLLAGVFLAVVVELFAGETEELAFSIRKLAPQTVLYTVYRGPYEGIGQSIGDLHALAARKKIIPRANGMWLVYLNNPQNTPPEHCLTEIRIPVGEEALQKAGSLGPMTDVKKVQPMDVAVMTKLGRTDYGLVMRTLYERIAKEGYRPIDNAIEGFIGDWVNTNDHSQMKSEIIVPVTKVGSGGN